MSDRFGDKRRSRALARLEERMVGESSVVVRKLGADRSGEIAAHRVLSSPAVTPAGILAGFSDRTAKAAVARRVVVAQDTTEVNFPKRTRGKLGPAGRTGSTPGFFLHAGIVVDVEEETVLGLLGATIWTRDGEPVEARRKRELSEKEAVRWLAMSELASSQLAGAAERIVVGDRESDIYRLFARCPADTHLLVRAAQNRSVDDGGDGLLLFEAATAWPVLGCQVVQVASRGPGDRGRLAKLELRAGPVRLCRPRHGRPEGDAASLELQLIEAVELSPPAGVTPLHWRLLTSLPGTDFEAALEAVRLYRLRWRIEQTFRMLKSDGLKLEESQTFDPHRLFNLAALALGAAVRIIQLVDARDGSSRPAEDIADQDQIIAAQALGPTLEGKTARQQNPHPPRSLAWLSWIVARLGGWNCYYKPPGPKTMRQGWDRFCAIAEGFSLARDAQDVRIP